MLGDRDIRTLQMLRSFWFSLSIGCSLSSSGSTIATASNPGGRFKASSKISARSSPITLKYETRCTSPCSVPFFHRFRNAYRLRQTRDYRSDFVEGAVEQLTPRSHPQRSYFHGPRVLYQRNGFIAYAHRRASTLLERCGERALAHQEIPTCERWWLLVRSLLLGVRFLPISDLRNLRNDVALESW